MQKAEEIFSRADIDFKSVNYLNQKDYDKLTKK